MTRPVADDPDRSSPDHHDHPDHAGPAPRRGLVLAGATAVLGAVGAVASALPAQAAAGAAFVLGRQNSAGSSPTLLTMVTSTTGLRFVQTGSAVAAAVTASRNTALVVSSAMRTRWGLHAVNTATSKSTGGAVRAEGRRNVGVLADTSATVTDVPAVVAVGGNGDGVSLVASGESYLDGDALALRNWVGVLDTDGKTLAYAHVVSTEGAQHATHGTASLDGTGAAAVTLPAGYRAACDMTSLTVVASPVGAAMPNLAVTYAQASGKPAGVYDGFAVSGGSASGKVAWVAWAKRSPVGLGAAAQDAQSAQDAQAGERVGAASTADGDQPSTGAGPAARTRLHRRALELPQR